MITIFFISLFVCVSMIISKIFEIKIRKIEFLSDLYSKGDQMIEVFIDSVGEAFTRYEKIVHIFLFDFIPAYFYELLSRIKDFVAKKYYETGNEFRGRRILKSTGSVSFFLERLSDESQNH